jgi:hypothetical protein
MRAAYQRFGARRLGAIIVLLLAGCATQNAPPTVDILDETTGMTAGALPVPLAFMETGIFEDVANPVSTQASIAYIGPVEWDRSGQVQYMLWVQIAPGVGGHRLDDISAPGAVNLRLDDGTMPLSAVLVSKVTTHPYQPREPVGQAAYFALDAAMLKRMADSQKLVLHFRAADLSEVDFMPMHEPRDALQQFVHDRGVGGE